MTNEEAIKYLIAPVVTSTKLSAENLKQKEAYERAIKALVRFRHIIIVHPKYGECDGWYDAERHLLFHDFITKEAADALGWKIKEVEE